MGARHARHDDDTATTDSAPLRLVDPDPFEAGPPAPALSPEVRAVLDAVAMLHSAVIGWAVATTEPDGPRHTAAVPVSGRHRR